MMQRRSDNRKSGATRGTATVLLLRGEFDHGPTAAGIAEGREDAARHAKVRVTHVSGFRGLG